MACPNLPFCPLAPAPQALQRRGPISEAKAEKQVVALLSAPLDAYDAVTLLGLAHYPAGALRCSLLGGPLAHGLLPAARAHTCVAVPGRLLTALTALASRLPRRPEQ